MGRWPSELYYITRLSCYIRRMFHFRAVDNGPERENAIKTCWLSLFGGHAQLWYRVYVLMSKSFPHWLHYIYIYIFSRVYVTLCCKMQLTQNPKIVFVVIG